MSLFERLRDKTSVSLLTRYGDVFRVTRSANTTFNPTTGAVSASTESQDVLGKSFSRDSSFDSGEMVETAEVEIYLTASGVTFTPQPGMAIKEPTSSLEPLQITRVQPIPESGTVVMFRILARR
jgi:hypothetical protein